MLQPTEWKALVFTPSNSVRLNLSPHKDTIVCACVCVRMCVCLFSPFPILLVHLFCFLTLVRGHVYECPANEAHRAESETNQTSLIIFAKVERRGEPGWKDSRPPKAFFKTLPCPTSLWSSAQLWFLLWFPPIIKLLNHFKKVSADYVTTL